MTRLLVLFIVAVWATQAAAAHEVRPGYLEVKALDGERVEVHLRQPITVLSDNRVGGLGLRLVMPETCTAEADTQRFVRSQYLSEVDIYACPGGLAAGLIRIDKLDGALTDIYAIVLKRDGSTTSVLLNAKRTSFHPEEIAAPPVPIYFQLGIEHLIFGWDHVLFVLGLMILVRKVGHLVFVLTSFTIAHSITLTLSILNVVSLPGPPVEACIALSIVFLAFELTRHRDNSVSIAARYPALVSFSFGLLHGFGFAGVLSDLGLPGDQTVWALLLFNLGIEFGQIMLVALYLIGLVIFRTVGAAWLSRANDVARAGLCAGAGYFMMGALLNF